MAHRWGSGGLRRSAVNVDSSHRVVLILVTGAHQFAADWVARVQGTLILYAATGDCTPFERAMASLLELAKENRRRKRRDPKFCWCPGGVTTISPRSAAPIHYNW